MGARAYSAPNRAIQYGGRSNAYQGLRVGQSRSVNRLLDVLDPNAEDGRDSVIAPTPAPAGVMGYTDLANEAGIACTWCGFFTRPGPACELCGSPTPRHSTAQDSESKSGARVTQIREARVTRSLDVRWVLEAPRA